VLRIFRHYLSAGALCLFVCEGILVATILYAAANSIASLHLQSSDYVGAIFIPALANSMLMYAMGLYQPRQLEDFWRSLPRLLALLCVSAPIVLISWKISLLRAEDASGARIATYVSWAAVLLACILLVRLSYVGLAKVAVTPHRVLVVGVGKLAAEIERLTSDRERQDSDTEIVAYVPLTETAPEVPSARIWAPTSSLLDVARKTAANEIVVALDERRGVPLQPLLEARMEGMRITDYLSFWERETRRVNLKALDPSWLIYSDGFRVGSMMNAGLKRLLDITVSLALLIASFPMLVLAAVAVRLDSRGPIFYKQERVGRYGASFNIYKFRTMRVDAEAGGVPQWAAARDPRITRIGSFLRMTRIDELPQVINVLRGDMSFVGPRPERPFFVQSLTRDIPFYAERHRVRPGITGWAQINHPYGASIEDAKAKLSYDLYYIKNYSFLFDLLIILSTAHAVLVNKGAH
jgi:sugar transferase (PEP-CTERM system associated)